MIARKRETEPEALRSRPFWPGFALEEMAALILFLGFVLLLASVLHPSMVFESGLDETELRRLEYPADPFSTPPRILPEWYFLATFELLKFMAPWLVMMLIGLFVTGFFFVPFIDRFLSKYRIGDWMVRLFGVGIVVLFILLTLRGMGLI
ncbi:MAG: hypothetical protein LN417_10560 [Candidatus Thermoplasmatota archaeon]|nr:hypothetical protein [Candidatus Thermoplasmatota archaeon]